MSNTFRKEVFYPHAQERVWEALTNEKALAEWLMPNNFEPVVGKVFRFQVDPMAGFSGINECEVLEVDPPHKLVFNWVVIPSDPNKPRHEPMVLTWTLHPEEGGTRLVLEQEGLDVLNWWWRFSMKHGWGRMMKTLLRKVVANVGPDGFVPGAVTRRDYKSKTVPDDFAK